MREERKLRQFAGFGKALAWLFIAVAWLFPFIPSAAAEPLNVPLDLGNPVYFYGDTIEYKGRSIQLDERDIYIDGTLSDETCKKYKYVYKDFLTAYNEGAIKSGTQDKPMNVYLAPYVYWVDNPDDPEVKEGVNGDKTPYGLWMNCSYLSLNGLTDKPENVVFAVNRGQNAGAIGNYTMFFINGTGTHTENLTMGNYCCVDLEYPLKPELGREKRQAAITQSQLVLTNGSKITAENCNFISRLNSCPFVGGTKILFQDCHFECTDDSLPTSAVYVKCDFDFYSSKPFYNTTGTGSVMLGCTFNLKHNADQFLTKAGGVVAIIDGTFYSTKKGQYIGWTPDPASSLRCYSGNITVNYCYDENGKEKQETVSNYRMDSRQPYDNVDITGKAAMDAYRIEYNNEVIYNVYNLLKGTDSYDPMHQKTLLETASAAAGRDYTALPTFFSCSSNSVVLADGDTLTVSTSMCGFTNAKDSTHGKITWEVEDTLKDFITLKDNGDGTCKLTCKNNGLTIAEGMIYAREESGLCSGVYITATPKTQPAPKFVSAPVMTQPADGIVSLQYSLPNEELLSDYSDIKWYRCSDAKGKEYALISVSAENTPKKTYTLSYGDIGYYIKAVVTPKQLCTYAGKEVTVLSEKPVELSDVTASPFTYHTDFSDFGYERQPQIIPGFWSRDVYKAWVTDEEKTTYAEGWTYGLGAVGYGSENLYGLMTIDRGARLLYTPPKGTYGDMNLTLVVNPEKNAGQGFGSAKQYLDIYIKFDTESLTGYALRLERISNLDCGVQAALIAYDKENVTYISDKVTTSAYNSECTITLSVKDGVLNASISTTHEQSEKQVNAGLKHSVELSASITDNTYGGTGIFCTGTAPVGNRAMFNELTINWDEQGAKLDTPVPVKLGEDTDDVKTKLKKGTVFTSGNVKFKVTNNAVNGKGTLMVAGITKKSLTSVKLANTITYKGVKYKVTGIGKNAFTKCSKMKKITIAATGLKTVQKDALKGIHKNCVIKVPKKQFNSYKKLLKNKGQKSTVKIKK